MNGYIRAALGIVAVLSIVAAGAAWVAHAENEHKDARDVGELTKQNAVILQSVKGWIDKDEAVKEEQLRIKACLEKHAKHPERCL